MGKRSSKELRDEVYQVFSELPEGRYLWGMCAESGNYYYWNLLTVKADTGPELVTVGKPGTGVIVKAKPGAKGDGWRHVCSIANVGHVILSNGVEFWGNDGGRHFALKVGDQVKELNDEVCEEATDIAAKLLAEGVVKMVSTQ